MVNETELFEYPHLIDFFLWVWMRSKLYKRKEDTSDELLPRILDVAVRKTIRDDQLRRTTRYLSTLFTKCIEVDGGICENLL